MKSFALFFILCLMQTSCLLNSAQVVKPDDNLSVNKADSIIGEKRNHLDSLLSNAPLFDVFNLDTIIYSNILKLPNTTLDSTDFFSIYQVDSLTKNFNIEYPSPLLLGKVTRDNYYALVVLRYYGMWFATVDFLSYDREYKLIGYLTLAAYGGDESYTYDAKGVFKNESIYVYIAISKEATDAETTRLVFTKCKKAVEKYQIEKSGKIIELEKESFHIECPTN